MSENAVFKADDPSVYLNYGLISILPFLTKVLHSVICKCLHRKYMQPVCAQFETVLSVSVYIANICNQSVPSSTFCGRYGLSFS